MLSVVVTLCHMIAGISTPICHEEVAGHGEFNTPQACFLGSQQIISEWKEKSIYSSDDWKVMVFACRAKDYVPKDAI